MLKERGLSLAATTTEFICCRGSLKYVQAWGISRLGEKKTQPTPSLSVLIALGGECAALHPALCESHQAPASPPAAGEVRRQPCSHALLVSSNSAREGALGLCLLSQPRTICRRWPGAYLRYLEMELLGALPGAPTRGPSSRARCQHSLRASGNGV